MFKEVNNNFNNKYRIKNKIYNNKMFLNKKLKKMFRLHKINKQKIKKKNKIIMNYKY